MYAGYLIDEGPMGVRLEVDADRAPGGCPGLGGWKRAENGSAWWTRIKGQQATDLLARFGDRAFVRFSLDGDRISEIEED